MTIEDLWLSHSHRVNADDSEKYMDEEDFKIAILEWESAKTVSRVELPVKPEIADITKITMWVDMIWNDIFDDDELPLTASQMNIIGKYINDAKEKIRQQFSV